MKVVFVSSEVYPFSKTGGLADVSEGLPVALHKKGIDVIIVTPLYKTVNRDKFKICQTNVKIKVFIDFSWQEVSVYNTVYKDVTIYFIEHDYFNVDKFYEGDSGIRFGLFNYATIELCKSINFKPDILHLNDWQTSLIPVLLKSNYMYDNFFQNSKTLITIHNLAYQGYFPENILDRLNISKAFYNIDGLEFYNQVNFLKGGILFSDYINTVSPSYAEEILTYESGRGLHGVLRNKKEKLTGILNGIDTDNWNPATDKNIFQTYDINKIDVKYINKINLQKHLNLEVNKDICIYAFIGRLTEQKGVDLILDALEYLMLFKNQLIILCEGDKKYKEKLISFNDKFKDKISVNFNFDEVLARKIYAGSDFFLMPSLFEPCGIGQLISMRYGTVPIVRAVGGLKDTVENGKTGFVFKEVNYKEFLELLINAHKIFNIDKKGFEKIVKNCMSKNYGWDKSSSKYIALYGKILKD